MDEKEFQLLVQEFEAQQANNEKKNEAFLPSDVAKLLPEEVIEQSKTVIEERTEVMPITNFGSVVGGVQKDILERAQKKISSEKIVDKHADSLKKVADEALRVQAEQAALTVEEQETNNKVRKQEIRNKLITLKAEAERIKKEQYQLNKEQKAAHKARNKAAKWDLYGDKLTKMKYSYVPCSFVLAMLLFFDGVRSFFDGLGTVSTAIVKALKWVLLIGTILIILFSIPGTRDWLTNLLSGGK